MRRRRGAALALSGIVATAACRQIVGIGDEPPGAGSAAADASVRDASGEEKGPPACGGFAWADSCASCTQSSCCEQATACRGDPICAKTYDCIAQCAPGDELCRGRCAPVKDDVMAALAVCQATSCENDCGLTCGGWGLSLGWFLNPLEAPACQACATSPGVCSAFEACARDSACEAAIFCYQNCLAFDFVCSNDCKYTHPWCVGGAGPACDAGADAGTVPSIYTFGSTCSGPCGLGKDWSCVGSSSWPGASQPVVTIRYQVLDYPSGNPVAGVTVKACDMADTNCANPRSAPAMTDASGIATFTLTLSKADFEGYVEMSKSGYVTTLYVPHPYLVENADRPLSRSIISASNFQVFAAAVAPYDASKGFIYLSARDCSSAFADALSLEMSPSEAGAARYYLVNGIPSATASGTSERSFGGGGFVNVDPGFITVSGSYGGKAMMSAELPSRAGAMTWTDLVPGP